jgi:DNA-binding MarR family transcriptional regulator
MRDARSGDVDKAKPAGSAPSDADEAPASGSYHYPPEGSTGYLVRQAHNALQRLLEQSIAPHGVLRGQWYFLRVLWEEEGLTQRELSARVGTKEPTTIVALRSMEAAGLVKRRRSETDRRKIHVDLTPKARRLRETLLPLAQTVSETATQALTSKETETLHTLLRKAIASLEQAEAE